MQITLIIEYDIPLDVEFTYIAGKISIKKTSIYGKVIILDRYAKQSLREDIKDELFTKEIEDILEETTDVGQVSNI